METPIYSHDVPISQNIPIIEPSVPLCRFLSSVQLISELVAQLVQEWSIHLQVLLIDLDVQVTIVLNLATSMMSMSKQVPKRPSSQFT